MIIDPKDVDEKKVSRIIDPNMSPDAMAARALANKQNMESNPLFQAMKQENERMRKDVGMLAGQLRAVTTRLHAILDYFTKSGLLLSQDMDDEGFAAGEPFTPDEAADKLFERLVDEGILGSLPQYGIEAYLAEHMRLGDFIVQIGQAQMSGAVSMAEVIEKAREFNSEPRRLVQVRGDAFGLPVYLNENPDELSEEELDALGAEFGLIKFDEPEEEENDNEQE